MTKQGQNGTDPYPGTDPNRILQQMALRSKRHRNKEVLQNFKKFHKISQSFQNLTKFEEVHIHTDPL